MYKKFYPVMSAAVLTASFWLLLSLCMATAVFTSCSKDDEKDGDSEDNYPTSAENVEINGVTWATCNLAAPGTFAVKPEDPGKFYQWNRKKAWAATGAVSGWGDLMSSGDTWTKANDPCPSGWHIPSLDEIEKLLDTDKVSFGWTTQNGVNGMKFTDKTSQKTLFLPAAGFRNFNDGSFRDAGKYGSYWSSTPQTSYRAYMLDFVSYHMAPEFYDRDFGLCIRPVKE